MKFCSFDLEIAKAVEGDDWKAQRPLGIACMALAYEQETSFHFASVPGRRLVPRSGSMTGESCKEVLSELLGMVESGYTLVTWNGAAFDFDVLAEESGMQAVCVDLALNHVDLMALVVATQGHFLSLEKAAVGAGLGGKMKYVRLNDGSLFEDMDGAAAPRLWAAGEYDAVLNYLVRDVEVTLAVADYWQEHMVIQWTAGSGRFKRRYIPGAWGGRLPTVRELLEWPGRHEVDTSWMSDPPTLERMLAWTGAV